MRRQPSKLDQSRAEPEVARVSLRVAVASGPALYREVFCKALEAESGVAIVGNASPEDDIGVLLMQSRPDVLLFDYEALGPNGEGLIARLRRRSPRTRILVFATRSGPETVERVLRAGASGLVGKESGLATVVRALRAVAGGEIWANRRVTAQALEHLADASNRRPASSGNLTEREAEVARWVGHGLRNKEIARKLGIDEKTVKTHLNNVFRKLRIDSRIELALHGMRDLRPKT
jgi:DNA-binding NarL/FixJ family response regulator